MNNSDRKIFEKRLDMIETRINNPANRGIDLSLEISEKGAIRRALAEQRLTRLEQVASVVYASRVGLSVNESIIHAQEILDRCKFVEERE